MTIIKLVDSSAFEVVALASTIRGATGMSLREGVERKIVGKS